MFDRFTDAAKRTMILARQEAQWRRDAVIDASHLLVGLASEPDGTAAAVLRSLNVGADDLRREIERIVPPEKDSSTPTNLPFTQAAKRVLERSMEEAETLGDRHIGTEHLLLALLREDRGTTPQALSNLRVEPVSVRRQVAEVRGKRRAREAQSASLLDRRRRRETIALLLREEDLGALSGDTGVPLGKLSEWRDGLLAALEASLRAEPREGT